MSIENEKKVVAESLEMIVEDMFKGGLNYARPMTEMDDPKQRLARGLHLINSAIMELGRIEEEKNPDTNNFYRYTVYPKLQEFYKMVEKYVFDKKVSDNDEFAY